MSGKPINKHPVSGPYYHWLFQLGVLGLGSDEDWNVRIGVCRELVEMLLPDPGLGGGVPHGFDGLPESYPFSTHP
jgi:hypothetical protein